MNCPKCKNDCPDGSEYCPVCYEVLIKKQDYVLEDRPPAPAPAGGTAGLGKLALIGALAAGAWWVSRHVTVSAGGSAQSVSGELLPSVSLPTLAGGPEVALDQCPTERCLTIYVAPWCPHCRAASGLIKAVKNDAAGRGVTTRVVVGMDQWQALRDYAGEFGSDSLLDADERFKQSGVPAYYVSDKRGVILAKGAGLPEIPPPSDPSQLRDVERDYFGLRD